MIAGWVLFFVPVLASLVLGSIYVFWSAGHLLLKAVAVVVFLGAVSLQFFSPYVLAGVLLQVALAMLLELRRLYWDVPMEIRGRHHGQGDFPA